MNAKVLDQVAVVETDTDMQAGAQSTQARGGSTLDAPSSEFDSLLRGPTGAALPADRGTSAAAAEGTSPAEHAASLTIEADIDGRRVRVVAKDEIVLECGSASITLRRNGRIVIKGTYIETCSEGTNRIKGGQVRIN